MDKPEDAPTPSENWENCEGIEACSVCPLGEGNSGRTRAESYGYCGRQFCHLNPADVEALRKAMSGNYRLIARPRRRCIGYCEEP